MRFSFIGILCIIFFSSLTDGRPIDKRSLDLSSLKEQAITYIKGIPARWREFIPEEVYQKGLKKYRQIKDKMEHFFEGDISGIGTQGEGNQNAVLAQAGPIDEKYIWPKGVVPYEISTAFAESEVEIIKGSLQDIMTKTCVKFVQHTTEADYISIVRRALGCSSYVGRTGGKQLVDLQPGCIYEFGEVQHEVMHALGFYHEQSRTDRDNFVSIIWDNVKEDQKDQFKTYVSNTFNLKYDYNSIMHYGWNYFAIDDTKPTILPKVKGTEIGNRKAMSPTDVDKINTMYKCSAASGSVGPFNMQAKKSDAVTSAPAATRPETATKCFLIDDTTTEGSGVSSWLMNKLKTAAAKKVCSYISG